MNRNQYKAVWSGLSNTETNAKIWVQGTDSEAQLLQSAQTDSTRIRARTNIQKTDDVLEIGCGVGRVGVTLASVCRTWTGCDVSPNMLTFARSRLAKNTNVKLVEISGYDLKPTPSASQDVVYCTVVFMHLTEWDRYNYIEEAYRVLRPNGRIYIDNISITTGYGWNNFFQQARAIPPAERPPQIGSFSTPDEFRTFLTKARFRNPTVEIVDDAWVVGIGTK